MIIFLSFSFRKIPHFYLQFNLNQFRINVVYINRKAVRRSLSVCQQKTFEKKYLYIILIQNNTFRVIK